MAKQTLNQVLGKSLVPIEVSLVIFFLFFSESFQFPELINKAINLLNYVFLVVVILRRWKRMAYIVSKDFSLIAIVGFAICSILWSVEVDYSLREAIGMLRGTLFGIYLATCFSFQNQFTLFAWVSIWIVAVNAFVCVVFPDFGIAPDPNNMAKMAFVGIYPYKQILGRVMVLSLMTLIVFFRVSPRHRWLSGLGIVGAAVLLYFSRSSTYLIAAVVGVVLLPLHQIAKQGVRLRAVLFIVVLMIMVVVMSFLAANWESLLTSSGKGITFNGRTPIWTLALEQLMKRPFFGYGYSAFWGSDEGWTVYRGVPWVWSLHKHGYDIRKFIAHNAFVDLALQLGLIGLSMLVFNITSVIYRAIALMNKTHSWASFWMLQMLVIQLVGACFEISTYVAGNSCSWVIYVALAYASANLLHRNHRSRRTRTIVVAVEQPDRALNSSN